MSGNAKTRRANTMKLVHGVMAVGEKTKARIIMDRMIDAYGSSHHHLPRSTTALAAILRGEHTMTQVTEHNRRYSWRRNQ
jgi:hypothetical protein